MIVVRASITSIPDRWINRWIEKERERERKIATALELGLNEERKDFLAEENERTTWPCIVNNV